jgi:hypothetical protein
MSTLGSTTRHELRYMERRVRQLTRRRVSVQSVSHKDASNQLRCTVSAMQFACLCGTLCKYTTCIMRSSRCYWSAVGCDGWATCRWSQLTALLLGRLLGLFLSTGARSMRRAGQWSQRASWSGWLPRKSSLTCSYRWLHCDLQNVPHEHANCTAGTVHVNWSEAPS